MVLKRAKTLPPAVPSAGMSTVNFTNEQDKIVTRTQFDIYVYE